MTQPLIKILIVDDHTIVRLGIRKILEETPNFVVQGEAGNGEEALQLVKEQIPDIVLLDVKMPRMGGLETANRLLRMEPKIKIIALTAYSDDPLPSKILGAGAAGYITKSAGMPELINAIEKVFHGEKYLTYEIAQKLALKNLSDDHDSDIPVWDLLSERELQVMTMISSGLKAGEIARRLCISTKTVNTYRYRLFQRFKVKNDVGLSLFAIRHGLIECMVV